MKHLYQGQWADVDPSGIGLGICQRLIDTFLATRSLTSHLVVIPTTRSPKKSAETIALLRKQLRRTASSDALSTSIASRASSSYSHPRDTLKRVHILSVQLDLCDFTTIHKAADQLVNRTLSTPALADDVDFEVLKDVKIPRLDAVVLNAGIGGWTGVDWLKAVKNFLTSGWIQATTWPEFKAAESGYTVNPLPTQTKGKAAVDAPVLGQVFCANVFGHYLFAHAILPLLSRPLGSDVLPGRIIWESSIEPAWGDFSLDDFQGTKTNAPYENSKRLTDVMCLSVDLPSVRQSAAPYFETRDKAATKPKIYLAHPGIVVTTIFPLALVLFYAYRAAMYVSRWIGSPWHTVSSYNGAAAMVWLALTDQETLDAEHAQNIKWGSATDFWGNSLVKKTEVDGWGWEGRVEDKEALARDDAAGVLRKIRGRRSDAMFLTEEKRVEFEEMGAECWKEMEKMREEWEQRLASQATK